MSYKKQHEQNMRDRFRGCLLGGALGDALGWPVEFCSLQEIIERFDSSGIREPVANNDGLYEITDDTQMTLFTAEGCLQAWTAARHFGPPPDFRKQIYNAYRRWLYTQQEGGMGEGGWLLSVQPLHNRRAPGGTCTAYLAPENPGLPEVPVNDRKGCGGIMRTAPCGLIATRIIAGGPLEIARFAFKLGSLAAALTHGHPSGYLPAGYLAALISALCQGSELEPAIELALEVLKAQQGCGETIAAIEKAVALSMDTELSASPETIELLGGGWVGEEALAISLYCSLKAQDDVIKALQLAVNHSGDSDSTGSITGNILGALHGESALPVTWLQHLELSGVIWQMGEDLFTAFQGTQQWLERYLPRQS